MAQDTAGWNQGDPTILASGIANAASISLGGVTAGSTLVILASGIGTFGSPACTDTKGNTYTLLTSLNAGGNVMIFSAVMGSSGANTVTFTAGGANNFQIISMEIAGIQGKMVKAWTSFNVSSNTPTLVTDVLYGVTVGVLKVTTNAVVQTLPSFFNIGIQANGTSTACSFYGLTTKNGGTKTITCAGTGFTGSNWAMAAVTLL
jgi:hypothetical protein